MNTMICPGSSDPFEGQNYRIFAMIHQPLCIVILGKLYSYLTMNFKLNRFLRAKFNPANVTESIEIPKNANAEDLLKSKNHLRCALITELTTSPFKSTRFSRFYYSAIPKSITSIEETLVTENLNYDDMLCNQSILFIPTSLKSSEQITLADIPKDDITSVKFSPGPSPDLVAITAWDNSVTLYGTKELRVSAKYHHLAPAFDLCFLDSHHTVSGSADGIITEYDISMGQTRKLGKCERSVSVVHYNAQNEMLFAGSWDCTVSHIDPKSPSAVASKVLQHPDSVVTMDSVGDSLVVGCLDRHIWVWDIRNLNEPTMKRESSLRYPTRCIRCFLNHQGYVVGSIEGRVSLEVFNSEDASKKYAFKCHRTRAEDKEIVYPVTALAVHPTYNTFATGGCDATVAIWDGQNKKRLTQLPKFPAAISSLAFSDDGQLLAIASSYMWERGEQGELDKPEPSVTIRCVADTEVRPKHMTAGLI
ncbi:mitotic spindle checkpoint protein Bub3 [Cichlidogyrus casuarinus]|uniref:Mitotic spindle checkpoint protein Bub3 n=1 Tax=Cichlidogyrus casuarinus TaxID=1844966 RepID=A0ABD2QJT0_9PLAT